MPFFVLGRWWWMVRLAGSFWAPLARPVAGLLRRVKPDPLPQLPAGEELLHAAEAMMRLRSELLQRMQAGTTFDEAYYQSLREAS
jgi:hypothetical protein